MQGGIMQKYEGDSGQLVRERQIDLMEEGIVIWKIT